MSNTTNDEQAKYGKEGEQPKREPRLSDDELDSVMYKGWRQLREEAMEKGSHLENSECAARAIRAYYEDLIDRGVLIINPERKP